MAPVVRGYIFKETVKKHILIIQDQDVMDSRKLSPDTVKTMLRVGISTKDITEDKSTLEVDSNVFRASPPSKFFTTDKDHRGSHAVLKAKTMKAKPRKKKFLFRVDKSLWHTARPSQNKKVFSGKVDCPGFTKPLATNAEICKDPSPSVRANGSMIPVRARKLPDHGRNDLFHSKKDESTSSLSVRTSSVDPELTESPRLSSGESTTSKPHEDGARSMSGRRPEKDEKSDAEVNSIQCPILCGSKEEENFSTDGELRNGSMEAKSPETQKLQFDKVNEPSVECAFPAPQTSSQELEIPDSRNLQHSPEFFYGFPCLDEAVSCTTQVATCPTGKFPELGRANPATTPGLIEARKEWLTKLKTCQMECTTRRRAFSINDVLLRAPTPAFETKNIVALQIVDNAMEITEKSSPPDNTTQVSTDMIDVGCQTEEADLQTKEHFDLHSASSTIAQISPLFQQVSKSFEQLTISCSTPHIVDKLHESVNASDESQRPIYVEESSASNESMPKYDAESPKQLSSGANQTESDTFTKIEEVEEAQQSITSSAYIHSACRENEEVMHLPGIDDKDPSLDENSLKLQLSFPCTPRANLAKQADIIQDGNPEISEGQKEENTSEFVTPARPAVPEPGVDFEEDTFGHITPLSRWILPPGKKYRRSLSIIRHLEGSPRVDVEKGRNYEHSVEQVIKLQSRMGNSEATPLQTLRKRLSVSSSLMKQMTPRMAKRSLFVWSPRVPKVSRFTLYETPRASFYSPVPDTSINVTPEDKTEQSPEGAPDDFSTPQTSSSTPSSQSPVYTIVDLILTICKQTEPCSFSEILSDESFKGGCKLGEGVFGEVFSVNRDGEMTVLKIIPIEGSLLVNGEKQKTYSEILSEIVIAKVLHELRFNDTDEDNVSGGFAELVELSLVQGSYPERFLKFWREFDETKGSDNDYPNIFSDDQLFIVLEQGNGGKDLESYTFSTAKQALAVFKQIVFSLAAAECSVEFEHRDLHWGNVLISKTSSKTLPYKIKGQTYTVPTHGVKTTIIDYTLSRIKYLNQFPIYNDIGKDPGMFIAYGDYQFDVYRLMKDDVVDDWSAFAPKTNVRWLMYLVDKMVNQVKYSRNSSKIHRDSIKTFEEINNWIESCDSAFSVALKLTET